MPYYTYGRRNTDPTGEKTISVFKWLTRGLIPLIVVNFIVMLTVCIIISKGKDRQTVSGGIPWNPLMIADIVIGIVGGIALGLAACFTNYEGRRELPLAFTHFLFGSGFFITGILGVFCYIQNGVNGIVGLTSAEAQALQKRGGGGAALLIIASSDDSPPAYINGDIHRRDLVRTWLAVDGMMMLIGGVSVLCSFAIVINRLRAKRSTTSAC